MRNDSFNESIQSEGKLINVIKKYLNYWLRACFSNGLLRRKNNFLQVLEKNV